MSGFLVEGRCIGIYIENIRKTRLTFFHFGSIGMFKGDVSPLSSRAVLESRVTQVLLFGCENWTLKNILWQKLEAFQGKVAKGVLKWPRDHSNTAPIMALEVPRMRYRILVRKLGFLFMSLRVIL